MAEKRLNDEMETAVSKKFKQTEFEDISLDNSDLSEDVRCFLEFDAMLKTFVFGIEKTRKDGNRQISVSEEEIENMLKMLPALTKISSRYASKRSPRLIDIPFQISKGEIGELVSVMSLKENMFKRGQFDLDIRKCVRKEEDGVYRYTSEGVRFSDVLITEFEQLLLRYKSLISDIMNKTEEVMVLAAAFVVMREITELSQCPGCKIQHPSQDQHMGSGGCMSEEKPAWGELVNQYWQAAWCLIQDDGVLNLAREAVMLHEESQVCIKMHK